jgi:hypothetical protein
MSIHDPWLKSDTLKLRDKYDIKIFIETGTDTCDTILYLKDEFDLLHTIDNLKVTVRNGGYNMAKNLNIDNIIPHLGHSPDVLKELCEKYTNTRVMFFLDTSPNPVVLDELEVISNMNVTPVIIINDFYIPDKVIQIFSVSDNDIKEQREIDLGCDMVYEQKLDLDLIKTKLDKIYGIDNFNYFYTTQVEIARSGNIYIEPNA